MTAALLLIIMGALAASPLPAAPVAAPASAELPSGLPDLDAGVDAAPADATPPSPAAELRDEVDRELELAAQRLRDGEERVRVLNDLRFALGQLDAALAIRDRRRR